ncbi:Sensory box histidine kinase/response regulator, partial [Pseudomonas coronafaciens pv. garcae]
AKGLGLGLAIADGLCRILEHPLQVRSWTGKGSVFSVRVPLATAQAPIPATQADISRPALNGTQVLCIDNEDSILIGMNSLLSRWGCQVWTARNRQE